MTRLVRAAALPVSRWANGAGRKADIAAGEGWLVGLAWLDADAPFSRLPGMDRTITLVEGPGFTLDVDGEALPVAARFAPARFDGGAETRCRVAGRCRVLNVMTDRARLRHGVTLLDRAGPVDPGACLACLVVALEGEVLLPAGSLAGLPAGSLAGLPASSLARLDAALVQGPVDLSLSPGGRAACIVIDTLPIGARHGD